MFVYQGRRYVNPVALVSAENQYVRLTPEEIQRIPWGEVTSRGWFVGKKLELIVPFLRLSERFPFFCYFWMEDSFEREIAVLMALNPRLGAESPLRLLESLTIKSIIMQTMD